MTNTNIPPIYLELLAPLIQGARKIMEGGDQLHPVAFIGNLETRRIMPVMFDTSSDEAKDRSSDSIRLAAGIVQADFVALLMESWALRPEMVDQYKSILARYGSIGASPYRVDMLSFTIETRHGVWMAQSPIVGLGEGLGRTFDDPLFQLFTEVEGRFVGLLPVREKGAAGGLH